MARAARGNFDLVGNNMPVFFIQDGIKIGATGEGASVVKAALAHGGPKAVSAAGVVRVEDATMRKFTRPFVQAIAAHRHWARKGSPE